MGGWVDEHGETLQESSRRIVTNDDGSIIEEVITTLKRPEIQAYQLVKGMKPPFAWLVRTACGEWRYEAIAAGTRVTWRFQFELQNGLAYFAFVLAAKQPFQTAQEICLSNLKQQVEII